MEWLPTAIMLAAAVLVVGGLWRAGRGRSVFVVRLARGEPRAVAGTVTRAFLAEVRDIAALHGVTRGRVAGVADGGRIRLEFSGQFPQAGCQQLRNWWGIHGWKAGRPAGPRPPGMLGRS